MLQPKDKPPKTPKNQKISNTFTQTKSRHDSMVCKTYEIKIDKSQLSKKDHDHLFKLFLEKKWIYNYLVTLPREVDKFKISYKEFTKVEVKVRDQFETRQIKHLSAQMKQSIVGDICNSIKSLSAKKKKNKTEKIGALKPKSWIGSISLKQYNKTWYITRTGKHIKIQGIKRHLRTNGLDQIPPNAEITTAKLILKHGDFFLKITCYLPRQTLSNQSTTDQTNQTQDQQPKLDIKIDFGIKTPLTIGIDEENCIDVNYRIKPSKRLKRLSRSLSTDQPKKFKETKTKKKKKAKPKTPKSSTHKRKKKKRNKKKVKKIKRSHNYNKTQNALRKEHTHIKNIKTNIINHIVHDLNKISNTITIQKDNIAAWKSSKRKGWGSKLHDTNLGGFRRVLRERAQAPIEVPTFFASTQTCFKCGHRQKMPLEKRVFICENPKCNWVCDRNHNATLTIGQEGQRIELKSGVPREPREFTSGETGASALALLACLNSIPQVEASPVVEPQKLLARLGGRK